MVLSTIYFVRTIKNQRRHTWDSTKHEVLFIVGIVILTYALKLSIRFYFLMVDKEPYIDNILNAVASTFLYILTEKQIKQQLYKQHDIIRGG
eukprot:403343514